MLLLSALIRLYSLLFLVVMVICICICMAWRSGAGGLTWVLGGGIIIA